MTCRKKKDKDFYRNKDKVTRKAKSEEDPDATKYRDRAEERRSGIDMDVADTTAEILATTYDAKSGYASRYKCCGNIYDFFSVPEIELTKQKVILNDDGEDTKKKHGLDF